MSNSAPPPSSAPPPHSAPPPPGGKPRWARKRIAVPAAVIILLVGIGIGSASNKGTDKTDAKAAPTATATVTTTATSEAEPAPTVTITETSRPKAEPKKQTADAVDSAPEGKAVFKVWGSAPSGVDITYGSDGTNLEGSGLPMKKTMTVKDDALYYQVTAQLMGSGDIHCSITIGEETKTGQAQGGYNICSAQLNSDFSGGYS